MRHLGVIVLALGGLSAAAQGTPQMVRESEDPLVSQFVHARSDGPVQFHYPAPAVADDFAGAAR